MYSVCVHKQFIDIHVHIELAYHVIIVQCTWYDVHVRINTPIHFCWTTCMYMYSCTYTFAQLTHTCTYTIIHVHVHVQCSAEDI